MHSPYDGWERLQQTPQQTPVTPRMEAGSASGVMRNVPLDSSSWILAKQMNVFGQGTLKRPVTNSNSCLCALLPR